MGKTTLMERGMKDRRYRKTEEAILKVFFDEDKNGITMIKMARKAKVGRSTVYTHHHAIREILPDYERYILREYYLTIRKRLRTKNVRLRALYLDTLLFIARNRKIFEMFLRYNDRKILMQMLEKIESVMMSYARFSKNTKKLVRIYNSEVVELICDWGEKGFSENDIERLLGDIMYLVGTARERLMPINR